MKKRLLVLLAVSMSFLLFSYHSSFAGEGKIVLKPHINVSWQSDSNFWWAEEDEKEVYTYLMSNRASHSATRPTRPRFTWTTP